MQLKNPNSKFEIQSNPNFKLKSQIQSFQNHKSNFQRSQIPNANFKWKKSQIWNCLSPPYLALSSYQKKVWHQPNPAKPSLGMTLTTKITNYKIVLLWCDHRLFFTVGVMPKEGVAGVVPPKPSLSMMTKILLPVFTCHSSCMLEISLTSYTFKCPVTFLIDVVMIRDWSLNKHN